MARGPKQSAHAAAAPIPRHARRFARPDLHAGRDRTVPRRPGPSARLGGQQRRGLPHPPRGPHLRPALLPAAAAPPARNLRHAAARGRTLPLRNPHARGLDRRRARRLDRGRNARPRRAPGGTGRGARPAARPGGGIRPPGRGAACRREGARRPETRKHRRRHGRRAAPDRLRRRLPARLRRGAELGAGHGGLPAPGTHGRTVRRTPRRLPRGTDLHGAARAGVRSFAPAPPRCSAAGAWPCRCASPSC